MPDINVSPLLQGNPSECVETFTYNASDQVETITRTDTTPLPV